jgi:micrococcal nuclease
LLALTLALLVPTISACTSSGDDQASAGDGRSPTPTPYVRAGLQRALVTRVVDGDTVEVEIDGVEYDLRYIGIDTPETVHPSEPVECFGPEASAYNEELVEGKVVGLEKDVSDVDGFGRLLRYVWLGDEMVNATLVREGYAFSATYPPDVKHQEALTALQHEARIAERGFWGSVCRDVTSTATWPPIGN